MWTSISPGIRQWISAALRRVQRAQGLVEYGLIMVLVSIVAIVIMQTLGTSIISLYSKANGVFPGA